MYFDKSYANKKQKVEKINPQLTGDQKQEIISEVLTQVDKKLKDSQAIEILKGVAKQQREWLMQHKEIVKKLESQLELLSGKKTI